MGSYSSTENSESCYLIERFIAMLLNIQLITIYTLVGVAKVNPATLSNAVLLVVRGFTVR